MENNQTYKTPKTILAKMQVVHFGKILFNLQFIALAIMAASVLSFIMPAIYYLVLICIMLLTLFTAFANPTFKSLWAGGETLTKIAEMLTQSWQYTVPVVIGLSLLSIICLCFDRNNKHIARIVVSSIICVIGVVILVLKLINGGGA